MSDTPSFAPDDDALVQSFLRHLDERPCLSPHLLDQLVVGLLPAAAAAEVTAHLKDCLACLHAFSRLQSLHERAEPRVRLIVDSSSTRRLFSQMSHLARMDEEPGAPPILIAGEVGTGKGVMAREIHALSRRAARAFVEVECGALKAFRLELELFGAERGGGDAPTVFPGLFEAADGGTLFLDSVDALSLHLQGRLLAVLDSREVRRLGGIATRALDVHVIVATHVDLAAAACQGTFRADLLARFARSTLSLLPLRERPDDILPLARHFARRLAVRHGEALRLTTDAEEQLRRYAWPGNVRELSNVIERAARRRGREEIGAAELGLPRA